MRKTGTRVDETDVRVKLDFHYFVRTRGQQLEKLMVTNECILLAASDLTLRWGYYPTSAASSHERPQEGKSMYVIFGYRIDRIDIVIRRSTTFSIIRGPGDSHVAENIRSARGLGFRVDLSLVIQPSMFHCGIYHMRNNSLGSGLYFEVVGLDRAILVD